MDIGLVLKKGRDGVLYDIVTGETWELIDLLEKVIEESISSKSENFINWDGLKYQKLSILNVLHSMGYEWIEGTKASMRVKDMRGKMADNRVFYIQIKTGARSFVTLQGVEQVIGQKAPAKSFEELKEYMSLYHYVRNRFLEGQKRAGNRILYSGSSISRTLFNRNSTTYKMGTSFYRHSSIWYNDKDKKQANILIDNFCRPCTHGGYNAMNADAIKHRGPVTVLDVNSLYPFIACSDILPTLGVVAAGDGIPEKKYIRHKESYYTFMKVEVSATLKKDGIPCILPDSIMYSSTHFLSSISKRVVTLSESDRKLLYENYSITYFRIRSYIVFKATRRDFKDYIEPLYEAKRKAKDSTEKSYYKLMINGLIGTFGKRIYKDEYIVAPIEDGTYTVKKQALSPEKVEEQIWKSPGLCYVNSAIVSGARRYIVSFIRKYKDRWLYTDTDSIHLKGSEIPKDIPISDKMGDFKVEHRYSYVRYYGTKRYIGVEDGEVVPTLAGIPKDIFKDIPKGYDKKYFEKCLSHRRFDALKAKPIGIYQVVEDISSLTVSYQALKGWIAGEQSEDKTQAQRRCEEVAEWLDNKKFAGMMSRAKQLRKEREVIRCLAEKVKEQGKDSIPKDIYYKYQDGIEEYLMDSGIFFF